MDLTSLRTKVETMLTDTCLLVSRTWTLVESGSGGRSLVDDVPVETACLVLPSRSLPDELIASGMEPQNVVTILVSVDTTITKEYKIEHGNRIYEILNIKDTSNRVLKQITCKETSEPS